MNLKELIEYEINKHPKDKEKLLEHIMVHILDQYGGGNYDN